MRAKRLIIAAACSCAAAALMGCIGAPNFVKARYGGAASARVADTDSEEAAAAGAPAAAPAPKPVQASFNPADFGSTLAGWILTKGYRVNGAYAAPKARSTASGIQVLVEKGHYDDDGNYAAIISEQRYKLDGLTLEFSIDRVAGDCSEVDAWINFSFLTKKAYFSVSDVEQSKGLVCLIRPYPNTDGTIFQFFDHVFAFSNIADYGVAANPIGRTFVVQIKKGEEDEWVVSVDGKEAARGFYDFDSIFSDGTAHIAMGASTDNDQPSLFTIRKINNSAVR